MRRAATSERGAGSAVAHASGDARSRRGDVVRGECVLFELGGGAAAIPMHVVERVLNVDGVVLEPAPRDRARASSTGSPALHLGEYLRVDARVVAWLVLSSPEPTRWPNVLLGVGHCIGTRVLADVLPLPVGFHAVHRGLVTGCFSLEARDRGAARPATTSDARLHGVVLDPTVLTRDDAWAEAGWVGQLHAGPAGASRTEHESVLVPSARREDLRAGDAVEASWTGARK